LLPGWTHRRALKVLAKAGPRGVTEAIMLAHGFTADMQAGLVLVGPHRLPSRYG